jgi:hypothetical protein
MQTFEPRHCIIYANDVLYCIVLNLSSVFDAARYEAIDDMITDGDLDAEYRPPLVDYFKHTAHFLMKAHEKADVFSRAGTYDEGSDELYHYEPPVRQEELSEHEALLRALSLDHDDELSVVSGASRKSTDSKKSIKGDSKGGKTKTGGKKGKKKKKKSVPSSASSPLGSDTEKDGAAGPSGAHTAEGAV